MIRVFAGGLLIFGLLLPSEIQANDPWRTIRIDADEYRFIPNRITLKAGEAVRIEVHNLGNEEHEFRSNLFKGPLIEILGKGVIVKGTNIHSIMVETKSKATIKWLSPEPGEYFFECRIPSHHGMDGVFTVTVDE